jgi:hypothetical protein
LCVVPSWSAVDGYIRLTGKTDRYFVAYDGNELLRGEMIEEADETPARLCRRHGARRPCGGIEGN